MSYRIHPHESVETEIRRVAIEQVNKAVAELTDTQLGTDEAVHQARKRFKKIRAVLRLARGSLDDVYSPENAWFRDLGRDLARVRDADAVIETLDGLRETFGEQVDPALFENVRAALVERREQAVGEAGDLAEQVSEVAGQLRTALDRIGGWRLDQKGFDALGPGLQKTYRRGRKALDEAYEQRTPEAFHEWRKRVKYHWYHMRLLREAWPEVLNPRRRAVKRLADFLGDHHDLAVFRRTLSDAPRRYGDRRDLQTLLALAEEKEADLAARARPLGQRIFAEKPKAFMKRIRTYWLTSSRRLDRTSGVLPLDL